MHVIFVALECFDSKVKMNCYENVDEVELTRLVIEIQTTKLMASISLRLFVRLIHGRGGYSHFGLAAYNWTTCR